MSPPNKKRPAAGTGRTGENTEHAHSISDAPSNATAPVAPRREGNAGIGMITSIREVLRLILEPGQVTELRALDAVTQADRRPHTESGYFDDPDTLAAAVVKIVTAKGIYFIPNPINTSLLARAANRSRSVGKEPTTSDNDIIARRWLLIDCDPVRPAGISASDQEHSAAISRATQILKDLAAVGWPWPILADSGNGAHLLFRVDLPADDGGLVQRCLGALAAQYDDDSVKIDQAVFNPARIWKLYGTKSRKGDSTPERPHRTSRIIKVPEALRVVSNELLEALAASAPAPTTPARGGYTRDRQGNINQNSETLKAYLEDHGVKVKSVKPDKRGGDVLILDGCPINPEHGKAGDTAVVLRSNGIIGFECKHNGCANYKWGDLRAKLDHQDNQKAPSRKSPNTRPAESEPVLISLADVQPEPVEWLWEGRIARGKLTIIAGDPGLGKSFITLDMAARISTGTSWPDRQDEPQPVGGVVLLSAEDDLADTIRPRLDAAGADVGGINALQTIKYTDPDTGDVRQLPFTLANLPELERAIAATPDCRLVIIDPISAYMGRADSHVNAEVRAMLAPLSDLAAKHQVAIVGVTHLRKGEGKAVYRAMGSLAFVAAARAVWAVLKDSDDESGRRRLFLPVKNNIGPDEAGLAYTLEPTATGAPAVSWSAEPVSITVDEAMTPPRGKPGPKSDLRDAAMAWLRNALSTEPRKSTELIDEAMSQQGISVGTLRRAKSDLGVVAYRQPRNTGPWWWRLPADDSTCAPAPTPEESAHLAHLDGNSREGEFSGGADGADAQVIKLSECEQVDPSDDDSETEWTA